LAACVLGGGIVAAQGTAAQDAPSSNATANLIRLLVKQHVIKPEEAQTLLKEAEQEAAQVRAQAAAAKPQAPLAQSQVPPAGTLRIPYVPQIVKNQIRDEVKKEVMQQARAENWAQPEAVPEWTRRLHLTGDLRSRIEYDLFASGNADDIIDYQSFNANGPTDIGASAVGTIPFLNTTQDRLNRLSVRARLGLDAVVSDGVLLGIRLASGGDGSPVSTTQLLGGGFGKKDLWLDQAYLTLEPWNWLAFTTGRMPNPFFHSDLVYDSDLNFDGAALAYDSKQKNEDGLDFFATEGLFPLEYIGSSFPSKSQDKIRDKQKWLWGTQVGVNWKEPGFQWRFAASYYQFGGIQGQLSAPCKTYEGDACTSDWEHPAFMQKGNTLFLTRLIIVNPENAADAQPQFAGLTFNYRLVNATTEFSIPIGKNYSFVFDLDYVHNLAYHATLACRYAPFGTPLTNVLVGKNGYTDPCDEPDPVLQKGSTIATFKSGPDGYYVTATFGDPQPRKLWEWNLSVGYKYLEPDAVPDGYTDSDFHLGGTNARGYVVSGSLGLFNNTWLTGRYMSASQVYGPPLAIDVIQVDLNAGF